MIGSGAELLLGVEAYDAKEFGAQKVLEAALLFASTISMKVLLYS